MRLPRVQMPQEMWDTVSNHLSLYSIPKAAKALPGFNISPEAKQHLSIWGSIFKKNGKWLDQAVKTDNVQPLLLCKDVKALAEKSREQWVYAVLVLFDYKGDVKRREVKKSLRRHTKCGTTGALLFKRKKIILRIVGLSGDQFRFTNWEARHLFREDLDQNKLYIEHCVWEHGSKGVQVLRSDNIRGVDGPITRIKDLAPIFMIRIPLSFSTRSMEVCLYSKYAENLRSMVEPVLEDDKTALNYFDGTTLVNYWRLSSPVHRESLKQIRDHFSRDNTTKVDSDI